MKIRSDILRTYQSLHTWTGITTGLLLFIAFFAGALTMFKDSIGHWAASPVAPLSQLAPDQYDRLLKLTLAAHPEAAKALTLNFEGDAGPLSWTSTTEQGHHQVWQATLNEAGELVTHSQADNPLAELIDQLHRTAGIAGEVGHDHLGVYVLGAASLLYFLALVSGVVVVLPTLVRHFMALRTQKGGGRFWLDTHNLVGVTSLPFHLVIALTAVVFAFHDPLYGGLTLVYDDKPLFERPAPDTHQYTYDQLPSVLRMAERADELSPGYELSRLVLQRLDSQRPGLVAEMKDRAGVQVNPVGDRVILHPYTLALIYNSNPQGEQGVWGRTVRSFFALHFGSYGGEPTRWLYFVLGLGGALLFYSGNLLWLEKRRRRGQGQSRACRIMASLTVGVCLGSLAGIAAALAATKGLTAIGLASYQGYMALYYLVFAASLWLAFTLGASRASVLLLRFCAGLCLLVPACSLLALVLPSLPLWAPVTVEALLVELMVSVFGMVFWLGAHRTQRRASQGEADSVWSQLPSSESGLPA